MKDITLNKKITLFIKKFHLFVLLRYKRKSRGMMSVGRGRNSIDRDLDNWHPNGFSLPNCCVVER